MSWKSRLKEEYFRKTYPAEFLGIAESMGMSLIDFVQSYGGVRNDVLKLVPESAVKVLDVGCASGITGQILKSRGVKEVVGIELEPRVAEYAKLRLDNVLIGDVEMLEIPYPDGYFDLIMYNDILEHLVDPWKVLERHSRLLNPQGRIIMCVPNVQHYSSIINLLRGRWDYRETGLFAKSHLRYFCYKNIKDLVKALGFRICRVKRTYRLCQGTILLKDLAPVISLYVFRPFFVYQYIVMIERKSEDN